MSGGGTAARHAQIAQAVWSFVQGELSELPAGRLLGPRTGGAAVLVAGAHALGLAGPGSPMQVEILLAEAEWGRAAAGARASDLDFSVPVGGGGLEVRIRGAEWLRQRLADPGGLWLRQRAVLVRDPVELVATAVSTALADFRRVLPSLVAARYRDFREGFAGADAALEGLGRRVLLGRAVEAALALPILCRAEPHPPAQWLAWHLGRVHGEGERIAGLCARAAAGPQVDREALATLRRILDEALDAAGHGETVVRAYHRWA